MCGNSGQACVHRRKQKNARKRLSETLLARLRASKHSVFILLIEIPELVESLTEETALDLILIPFLRSVPSLVRWVVKCTQ